MSPPCKFTKLPDGSAVICCTRGRRGKPCYSCGIRDGTRLCDWPVTRNGRAGTCDKPMCERCANPIGPDKDYCHAHYRMHLREKEPKP